MAAREGGHPFNWFLIGFVLGVAATLAVMLYLGVRHDGGASDNAEIKASAAPVAAPAKPMAVVHAAPVVKKSDAAPHETRPRPSERELDAQVAEDAAAAGMTSRTDPGQPASASPDVPQ
jgi:hypothetical protein